MKKLVFIILFLTVFSANANQVSFKKNYHVDRSGNINRGPAVGTTHYDLGSTLQSTSVSTDIYVSATRKIAVVSPYIDVAGEVYDSVKVQRLSIRKHAESLLKGGLKSNLGSVAVSLLAAYAASKGWEWINEKNAWVYNKKTYPKVECSSTVTPTGVPGIKIFSNQPLDVCITWYKQQIEAAGYPIRSITGDPNGTLFYQTIKWGPKSDPYESPIKTYATGSPTDNQINVPEQDVISGANEAVKGKESQILDDDVRRDVPLPYEAYEPEWITNNPVPKPALSPSEVTSTTNTTNPDGSTSTTTTTTQKKYDYSKSPTGGSALSPTVTTTTTTTTTNNTTNTTTTSVKNEYKTPQQVQDESKEEQKEEESPPTPPTPEFPEIEEPKLDNTKIPAIVTDTMLGFPLIPTQFNCINPFFDAYYVKFDLPMCDWIERFRFLFHWFWLVSTGIAIYLLATSTKIGAK